MSTKTINLIKACTNLKKVLPNFTIFKNLFQSQIFFKVLQTKNMLYFFSKFELSYLNSPNLNIHAPSKNTVVDDRKIVIYTKLTQWKQTCSQKKLLIAF